MNNFNPQSIKYDSRNVTNGDVFIAIPGDADNGEKYIDDAIKAGASCIISEKPRPVSIHSSVEWIKVHDTRLELAKFACANANNPSFDMDVYGITGTNGKTTTTVILRKILSENNVPCGMLTTIGNSLKPLKQGITKTISNILNQSQTQELGQDIQESKNTTPGPVELQNFFREMVNNGCKAAVMEVSSHSLIQKRITGTKFKSIAFTNLTQDHLDFHKSMDNYYKAKELLFIPPTCPAAVNIDDKYGAKLVEKIKSFNGDVITFGSSDDADIRYFDAKLSSEGTEFSITYKSKVFQIKTQLLGRHNIYNCLTALALAINGGIAIGKAIKSLSTLKPVKGRLERAKIKNSPATFFVDYAHTPDAIENVLRTLREITEGRLFIVFGAGGNRDRQKRPLMGKAAYKLADVLVITSDNPRKEEPEAIIDDILAGIPYQNCSPNEIPTNAPKVYVITDRRTAIRQTTLLADQAGDVVLVAGKGHENYQIFSDHTEHFDDMEEILSWCK